MANFVNLLGGDDVELMVNPDLVERVVASDDGRSMLIFGPGDYAIVIGTIEEVTRKLTV